MIDLYYWPTPNGWKVTIMLEECGLDYSIKPVDIGGGDQFRPDFLRISPNNRMPAIIDHDPPGGGAPVALFESGAILEYLADKTGAFLPQEGTDRYRVLQWVHWQMANLGPMMGNATTSRTTARTSRATPSSSSTGRSGSSARSTDSRGSWTRSCPSIDTSRVPSSRSPTSSPGRGRC